MSLRTSTGDAEVVEPTTRSARGRQVTEGAGKQRRWPRAGVIVLAGLGLYVVLVLALHYLGLHITLPNEEVNPVDPSGGIIPASRELLGRTQPTDFYADYASAHALTHGHDAYAPMASLFNGLGPAWDVPGSNPHPPTTLALVLPLTALHYGGALTMWTLAMVFALIATLRLVGLRLSYSVGIGVGLALTYPAAYGIANPVPLIGLGVALAYRYRDRPAIAALGLALAAAPKGSGVILALPFLAAGRIKTVVYAAGYYVILAAVPVFFEHNVWQRYLKTAPDTIRFNANRADSGSLLRLARDWFGWSDIVTLCVLAVITIGLALLARDTFWPIVWAMVATLPIAWMYSLLTLLPLVARAVLISPKRVAGLAALATAVMIGSPPVGLWTPVSYFVIIVLTAVICVRTRAASPTLWLHPALARLLRLPVDGRRPVQLRSRPG